MATKFNGAYTPQVLNRQVLDSHVELEEVKRNLQFDDPAADHDDDDQIQGLIEAAIEACENYCGRYFTKSELTFKAYNFCGTILKLPVGPFISIKTITYNEILLTEGTDYDINNQGNYFEIYFYNTTGADTLEVVFYAGYNSGDLPSNVRKFIIVEASDGYDTDRSKYAYQVVNTGFQQRVLGPFINTRY